MVCQSLRGRFEIGDGSDEAEERRIVMLWGKPARVTRGECDGQVRSTNKTPFRTRHAGNKLQRALSRTIPDLATLSQKPAGGAFAALVPIFPVMPSSRALSLSAQLNSWMPR